jgi:hypothetical protein
MLTQLLRNKGISMPRALAMAAAVALAAIALPQRSANAALVLVLDGGTTNQDTILDNGIGDTANTITGTIVNTQVNYGGFSIAVSTANSNSFGTSASGNISVSTLVVTNNNSVPATITLLTSDTGFTSPGSSGSLMNLVSSVSGTSSGGGGTVSFQSFADPANAQPATAVSTAVQTLAITPSFNNTVNTSFTRGSGAYSLADFLSVTLAGGATATITGATTASVPEPTFGIVPALALGLLARRRRNAGRVR